MAMGRLLKIVLLSLLLILEGIPSDASLLCTQPMRFFRPGANSMKFIRIFAILLVLRAFILPAQDSQGAAQTASARAQANQESVPLLLVLDDVIREALEKAQKHKAHCIPFVPCNCEFRRQRLCPIPPSP